MSNLINRTVSNGRVLDVVTELQPKRNVHVVNKDSLAHLHVFLGWWISHQSFFAFELLATPAAEGVLVPPPPFFIFFNKKAVNGKVLIFFPKFSCFFSFSFRVSTDFSLFFRSEMAIFFASAFFCPTFLLCSPQRPMVKSQSSQFFTWMSHIAHQNIFCVSHLYLSIYYLFVEIF